VLRYPPAAWKGNAPKDDFQMQILASLTESERTRIPVSERTGRYRSDALDAVGLGLYVLGRLGRYTADPREFIGRVEALGGLARSRARRSRTQAPVLRVPKGKDELETCTL
jgi:hypothetical protein